MMQPTYSHENILSVQGMKQVKIDNWGTFFLQRLLQLYFNEELLDLKIKFHTTNNVLNVHKIVISTCTDYFRQLEREQNDGSFNKNVVTMPSDMPYECVKSIISFIYTGQLQYKTSDQYVLYHTAKKMNINVLTKLLETQLEKSKSPHVSLQTVVKSTSNQSQCLSKTKRLVTMPCDIPSSTLSSSLGKTEFHQTSNVTADNCNNTQFHERSFFDNAEGPSRFDIPEVEDMTLGVFSSFDDITYNTKPIIQASEETNGNKLIENVLTDSLCNKYIEIEEDRNSLRDQCKRSICSDTNSWLESESTIESEDYRTPMKKCRYNNNEKENKIKENSFNIKPIHSVSNHAKIIREVLKKYPHLVQNNKNIRLKIMQKESKTSEGVLSGRTKISYVVLTSDSLKIDYDNTELLSDNINEYNNTNDSENGYWKCTKCDLEEKYLNYSMYRMHMQGVHGYKFDPRICEYCGYKAMKRNILMYHIHTKHDVPLPENVSFPKCNVCSYVALTESLLAKHQANHKHLKSLNSQNSLKGSIQYNQHKQKFINTPHLAFPNVITNDKNIVNDVEKNNFSAENTENHEMKLDVHENKLLKYNSINVKNFDSTNRIYIEDKDVKSIENSDKTKQRHVNKKDLIVKKKTDTTNIFELENLKLMSPVNSKDKSDVKTELPLKKLGYDNISFNNIKENVLVYIENNDILGLSQSTNDEFFPNTNKIEKIEIMKIEAQKSDSKVHEKINLNPEEQVGVHENDYYSNLNKSIDRSNAKEVIQYIEEETEILEYETSNI